MSAFSAIASAVSARDAARFYGMQFSRSGRARCVWHDDHTPDLAFYGNTCHCFACGNGGDATALTAQLFGLSMLDAAKKLNRDFHLHIDIDAPENPTAISEAIKRLQEAQYRRDEYNRRWSFLCDVIHEADERLSRFPAENSTWDNPDFLNMLKARTIADQSLEILKNQGEAAL